ncbi:hypothetical protein [Paenibacillus graminis]|uniref:Uncharacterized protein n=1 Tax=Paenibacillus graminis TaxID=189425 RepID=A0A089MAU5_9BACL|nr:hypothetical protein [Paenibacillus graminis]AIQ70921.1 hypothetical protein PGRAT_27315 [Paenibacillus graminis]
MEKSVNYPLSFAKQCFIYFLVCLVAFNFRAIPYQNEQTDIAGGIEPNPLKKMHDLQPQRANG